jgi:hypothetical protein
VHHAENGVLPLAWACCALSARVFLLSHVKLFQILLSAVVAHLLTFARADFMMGLVDFLRCPLQTEESVHLLMQRSVAETLHAFLHRLIHVCYAELAVT